jgi:multidrug resistance protein, MATE family
MPPFSTPSVASTTAATHFSDDNVEYEDEVDPVDTLEPDTIWQEFSRQAHTALPTVACLLLYRCPWVISLRFVGALGADEMAAAALASTLANVTGMSVAVGLSSALTTLTGQARGNLLQQLQQQQEQPQRYKQSTSPPPQQSFSLLLPLVYLYRGALVQWCMVLPMGLVWISGVSSILQALGQAAPLSDMTAAYLRILAPGLWAYSIHWTLVAWLQVMHLAYVPAMAALVGVVLHIPTNYLLIHVCEFGYVGVAWGTVTFQVLQPCLLLCYIFVYPPGTRRVLEHMGARAVGRSSLTLWPELYRAISSLAGLGQYLALAVPGMILISEWWASEMAIFLAGRLHPSPSVALSGMTLYQTINAICFMAPMSWSVAGAARVSHWLGAGQAHRAARAAVICVGAAATVSGLLGLVLYTLPHAMIPSWFAPYEPDVVLQTSATMPLLAWYVLGDGIQAALNGIVKGTGHQCRTMPIVVVAYWIIALPLCYYLVFVMHEGDMECAVDTHDDTPWMQWWYRMTCGVVGLVLGMTTGTWVHTLLLAMTVGCCTNWRKEAHKAQERVRLEHYQSSSSDTVVDGSELHPMSRHNHDVLEMKPLADDDEYANAIELS